MAQLAGETPFRAAWADTTVPAEERMTYRVEITGSGELLSNPIFVGPISVECCQLHAGGSQEECKDKISMKLLPFAFRFLLELMHVTIHQPQFLPWLGYLDKIDQADLFIALDSVQFKKNEWQNRNRIRTADGCQWVTVPVLHHFGQLVKDVRINQAVAWRSQHLRAIEMHYARAAIPRSLSAGVAQPL